MNTKKTSKQQTIRIDGLDSLKNLSVITDKEAESLSGGGNACVTYRKHLYCQDGGNDYYRVD